MTRTKLASAFFYVILMTCSLPIESMAQNITGNTQPVGTLTLIETTQALPRPAIIPQAKLTLVSPNGGETFAHGNRYPISWRIDISKSDIAYKLMGELRLIDQNTNPSAQKKDVRIAFLTHEDIAKGSYTFLSGAQKDMTHDHTVAPVGVYKIWMFVKAVTECSPNAKCAPLFETTDVSDSAVQLLYR